MTKLFSVALISLALLASCSSQKRSGTQKNTGTEYAKDSIEFYETDFEVRQKSYMNELLGTWNINVMKRQAKLDPESLTNAYLTFNSDSTFHGKGGCNNVSGKYSLKGTSIKFNNIISTKMACENLDQEYALLRLLQETVSAFTVGSNSLLLRDGASNIVFEASKKRD